MAHNNFIVRGGLDMSGFSSGLKQTQKQLSVFQNTVTKSMSMVKIAIGSVALGSLVKNSLSLASAQEGALLGLKSIAEGQGKSYSDATNFIQSYISDGLIPLTNAVTAYKNLASRGYTEEEIQTLMQRLKDSASFGRQAALSLGEAVTSATEGLKNENSILVDNAGVTKNVSIMWQEYAASIGKGIGSLTQAEKRQAEVNGILKETRYMVGNADTYTKTYAGRLASLNKTLYDIKVNIGNAFMPIANVVIPVLQNLGNKLSGITSSIAAFSQALFGKSVSATITNTEDTASAISDVGDAAEKAGRQAGKAAAPFDELINISSGSGSSAGTGTGSGGTKSSTTSTAEEVDNTNNMASAAGKLNDVLQPTIDALKNLWDAVVPFAQSVGKGFIDFVVSLKDIGKEALNGWIPGGINAIAEGISKIDPAITESIGSGLGKIALFFAGFKIVTGLGEWFAGLGTGLTSLGGGLYSVLSLNPMAFIAIFYDEIDAIQKKTFEMMPKWVKDVWNGFWGVVLDIIKSTFNFDKTFQLAKDMVANFKSAFSGQNKAWYEIGKNIVLGIVQGLALPLSFIIEPIYDFFATLVKGICDVFGIKSPAKEMKPYGAYIMQGIIEGIKQGWVDGWKSFGAWLSGIPSKLFNGIGSLFNVGKALVLSLLNGFKSLELPKIKLEVTYETSGIFGKIGKAIGLPGFPKLDMKFYRNGGFPNTGDMFVANDNGPEMIGRIGNRTAVANTDQITQGIASAVYEANKEEMALMRQQNALLNAILDKTGITTGDIFKAAAKENDNYLSKTGRSRFA